MARFPKQIQPEKPGVAERKKELKGQVSAAHVRLNRKITAAAEAGQQQVLDLVATCCQEMSLVNASTAWHCLARRDAEDTTAWEADHRLLLLKEHTKTLLSACLMDAKQAESSPRCVATISWSCAKLRVRDAALMSILGDLAVNWLASFKTFELANVLWGFAKLQVEHMGVFQAAHSHLLQEPHHFSTRSLSMAAWAFATIRFRACQTLLCRMAEVFVQRLETGEAANPVTIANMIWALATARVHVPATALESLGRVASSELRSFKAHELSVMLWAFARLNACHRGLFEGALALLYQSRQLREEVHSQGIANLLWAFARLKQEHGDIHLPHDIITALQHTCLRLLPKLNAVEVSSLVWALSKLADAGHPAASRILLQVARQLLSQPQLMESMSAHGASGVLAAFSEFFSTDPNPPVPCQLLIAHLVELCAGIGPQIKGLPQHMPDMLSELPPQIQESSHSTQCLVPCCTMLGEPQHLTGMQQVQGQHWWQTVPAIESAAHAQVEQASAITNPSKVSSRLLLELPAEEVSVSDLEPAYVRPSFVVPATQDASVVHTETCAPHAPTIAFVDEFTATAEGSDDICLEYIDVAFEVDCVDADGLERVLLDTYDDLGRHDSVSLEINTSGVYTLRVAGGARAATLRLTLLAAENKLLGKPVAKQIYCGKRCRPRLLLEHFASASTTASSLVEVCASSSAEESD